MSDGQRIDGDDMTYWWQTLRDTGDLGVSCVESSQNPSLTLHGTMTGGDVAGLSLVDVPQTYNTQTHAQRTDSALWHIAKRLAELGDEVRDLRQQLADMTAAS